MWYLYTMEFYSATKKNEILSLAISGWNWRTSSKAKLVRVQRPKIHVTPHMWIIDLKRYRNITGHRSNTKGRPCTGGQGKGNETYNLSVVYVLTVQKQI
jgi:hypothetical protein